MKKVYTYLRGISLIIALLVLATGAGWGQEYDQETGKPILGPDIPRTALVRPNCLVNTIIQVVEVLSQTPDYNNMLDRNLNNVTTIPEIADIGVLLKPIVQVKDMEHCYAAGTEAGFCIEGTNEGNGILSLGILDMTSICFYRNGELVDTKLIEDENSNLLDLDVIQIQGEENVVSYLKATSDESFDEIGLMIGGVNVGVLPTSKKLSSFNIRYAFVGSSEEHIITEDFENCDNHPESLKTLGNIEVIAEKTGLNAINISNFFQEEESLIDANTESALEYRQIILCLFGGFRVGAKWDGEALPKGTEIVFETSDGGVLDIALANQTKILFYDKNGNEESVDLKLSVIGLNAIGGGKTKVSAIAPVDFKSVVFDLWTLVDVGFDLGTIAQKFYCIRVVEPTKIPEYCHIEGLSMDASICGNETTYELRPIENVSWELTKVVDSEDNDITNKVNLSYNSTDTTYVVSGLTIPGEYTFTATQTNEDGSTCTGEVVLKHGLQASSGPCNTPIKNESATDNTYEVAPPRGVSGGIEIFNNIRNRENVINSNDDDYADINPGIALLSNTYVMGIHKTNGTFNPEKEENKRISFLVDLPNTFLNVDALQFFYIMLYKDGEKVGDYSYTVDNWDAISAGLIGSEDFSKMRLGATIPKDVDFDEFALWTGGVASISLSSMRMYSAFVEDESADCDNPLNCDDAVFTGEGALEDAYINYDGTYLPAVSVGVGMTGLENLLSGEFDPSQPDKCVRYSGVVEALSPASIAVNFGRVLGPKQQAGFVVKFETYLASIDVIKVIQVKTYLEGVEQETRSDWGVLNADVIGDGDYEYLMINPKYPYDEIRLVMTSVVGALSNMTVHAVFVRNDSDGDGLPDCIDPNPCSDELTGLNVNPSDICEGEDVILSGSANFSELPKTYIIQIDNTEKRELVINKNGTFTEILKDINVGKHELTLKEKDNMETTAPSYTLYFTVHPKQTTWEKNIDSEDWNNWENWSKGSPWTCTDVIIPSDANTYPVLESGVMNGCRYIHFEPNAEVVNTHRLTYEKAWVELALHPNRYYMVTVPLKDTYSGDWFIPQTEPTTDMKVQYPEVFSVLDAQSLPENRVTPTVYQRVWDAAVLNKLGDATTTTTASTTKWSLPYNYLATKYEKNQGYDFNAVSVWIHPFWPDTVEEENKYNDLEYIFRFPKEHTMYRYYDKKGNLVSVQEPITREKANAGRFIYEDKDSTVTFPYTMKFRAGGMETSKVFLVGNPFMSHIDLNEFFKVNKHIVDVKVGNENSYASIVRPSEDGTSSNTTGPTTIAPMQSFFVTVGEETISCDITFTEQMLVPGTDKITVSPEEAPTIEENTISITASASDTRSSAMIRFSASASDNYREREDAEILIENETPPAVAIFTTAEDRALDIQQRANGGEIPLGMYLPKPEDVTLRIAVPDEYSGWMVEDVETNRRYPLMPGEETEIHVGRLTTNVGRFYLKGQSATGNETITATQPKLYCYREAGSHTLVVRSGSEMMTRCEVYGMDGRLRHIGQFETDEYRFPAQAGVQIVKAYFKDGITSTVKVF